MVNVKDFQHILRMKEEVLYDFLKVLLIEKYGEDKVLFGDMWLYAEGEIPIMLEAHLDTVHYKTPQQIFLSEKNIMWSPQGIGGDDRCGVMTIMEIIKTQKPYVLFCKQEETGTKGARAAAPMLKPDINFIVGLDRRGHDDAVYYSCDNPEFEKYVTTFGFKTQHGSFSDIGVLAPAWGCAAVNFSVGYYSEHTTNEHINLDFLQETIDKVAKIVADPNTKKYKYMEKKKETYYQQNYYRDYPQTSTSFQKRDIMVLPTGYTAEETLQLQAYY